MIMNVESILNFQILNNSVESWLKAVAIAIVIILLGKIVQMLLSGWLKKLTKKNENQCG
jgi:hypothetical protein